MNMESLVECRGVPAGNRLRTHRTDLRKPANYSHTFPPEVGSWGYNYGVQKKNGADLTCGCGEMLICNARPVSGTGNGAPGHFPPIIPQQNLAQTKDFTF